MHASLGSGESMQVVHDSNGGQESLILESRQGVLLGGIDGIDSGIDSSYRSTCSACRALIALSQRER